MKNASRTTATGRRHQASIALIVYLLAVLVPAPAWAGDVGTSIGHFASGTGSTAYGVAAILLPLVEDGARGKNHTFRALDAVGVSVLLSEGIKRLVGEERPDHSDRESFPSGHATAAFSLAAAESAFHPRQAPFWYAGAALIGASRVTLHRHRIHDVLAGALLGWATTRWELSRPHGLVLSPVISSMSSRTAMGFRITLP